MYTIHKKRDAEHQKSKEAEMGQKPVQTISRAVKQQKSNSDFVLPNTDLDLRIILDRRTQCHRGSAQFIGIDNTAFQLDAKEDG